MGFNHSHEEQPAEVVQLRLILTAQGVSGEPTVEALTLLRTVLHETRHEG